MYTGMVISASARLDITVAVDAVAVRIFMKLDQISNN